MGFNNRKRLTAFGNRLTWILFSFFTLYFINICLIGFFLYLQPPPPRTPDLIVAALYFLGFLLSGRLFFTVFYKPKTLSWLPDEEIVNSNEKINNMIREVLFTGLWTTITSNTIVQLVNQNDKKFSPLILFLLFIAIMWTASRIRTWYRYRFIEIQKLSDLPNPSISFLQTQGLRKITSKLTDEEQHRLISLVYEAESSHNATVLRLARIVANSLAIALALAVAEEIFRRL
jgi:hypothetical protein